MGDLLIRNIPDAMKRDIAARAERNGTSLSDEAKELLGRAMAIAVPPAKESGLSLYEEIRAAFESAGASGDEFSEVMDEIEVERKRDFGRPFEAFE